jgi:tetraacyldisaccharide 4'-kinase
VSLRASLERWLVGRWYGPRPILFLLPLSWLFGGLAALRRWMYRRGILTIELRALQVLVVGNLTLGGAGKTPEVLALIEGLRARGWRPGGCRHRVIRWRRGGRINPARYWWSSRWTAAGG